VLQDYAVFAQQDTAQALPAGWISGTDPSGATYYYNENTGQSQWEPPQQQEAYAHQEVAQALPEGWISGTDVSGATYYYNEETGQSQWEPPQQQGAQLGFQRSDGEAPKIDLGPLFLVASPFLMVLLVFSAYLLERLVMWIL